MRLRWRCCHFHFSHSRNLRFTFWFSVFLLIVYFRLTFISEWKWMELSRRGNYVNMVLHKYFNNPLIYLSCFRRFDASISYLLQENSLNSSASTRHPFQPLLNLTIFIYFHLSVWIQITFYSSSIHLHCRLDYILIYFDLF